MNFLYIFVAQVYHKIPDLMLTYFDLSNFLIITLASLLDPCVLSFF